VTCSVLFTYCVHALKLRLSNVHARDAVLMTMVLVSSTVGRFYAVFISVLVLILMVLVSKAWSWNVIETNLLFAAYWCFNF